eukprot:Gb_24351 [translate_table: standard]
MALAMATASSATIRYVPNPSSVSASIKSEPTKKSDWLRPTLSFSSSISVERRNLEELFTRASYGTDLNLQPKRKKMTGPSALLGGGSKNDDKKKKFISKEEEPEQYWQTAAERDGVNPMTTPLPYIVIFGFLTPFIILGVAFANGWIKMPLR